MRLVVPRPVVPAVVPDLVVPGAVVAPAWSCAAGTAATSRVRTGCDVAGARRLVVAEQVGLGDRGGVLGVAGRRDGRSRPAAGRSGTRRRPRRPRRTGGASAPPPLRDRARGTGRPAASRRRRARRPAAAEDVVRSARSPRSVRGTSATGSASVAGPSSWAAAIAAASSAAVHGRRFSTTSSGVSGPSSTWPKVTAHRVSRSFGTSLTTSPGGTGVPPIRGAGSRPLDLAVERPVAGEAGVDQGHQGDGVGARRLLARRARASLGGGVDAEALDLELATGRAQHAGGLQRLVVQAGRGDAGQHLGGLAHQRAHPVGRQRAVAAQQVGQRVGLDELGDDVGHRPGVAVLLRDVEHPQQRRLVDHRGAARGVHGVLGGGGGDQAHPDRAVQRGVDRAPEVARRGRAQTLLEAVPPRELRPHTDSVHAPMLGLGAPATSAAARRRPGGRRRQAASSGRQRTGVAVRVSRSSAQSAIHFTRSTTRVGAVRSTEIVTEPSPRQHHRGGVDVVERVLLGRVGLGGGERRGGVGGDRGRVHGLAGGALRGVLQRASWRCRWRSRRTARRRPRRARGSPGSASCR